MDNWTDPMTCVESELDDSETAESSTQFVGDTGTWTTLSEGTAPTGEPTGRDEDGWDTGEELPGYIASSGFEPVAADDAEGGVDPESAAEGDVLDADPAGDAGCAPSALPPEPSMTVYTDDGTDQTGCEGAEVTEDDTLLYEFDYTPAAAATLQITVTVPNGLTVDSTTISDGGTLADGVVTWADVAATAGTQMLRTFEAAGTEGYAPSVCAVMDDGSRIATTDAATVTVVGIEE